MVGFVESKTYKRLSEGTRHMSRIVLPSTISNRMRASHWRVLITGATGWMGQAALEMLVDTFGEYWRERVFAFGSHPRTWALRDGTAVRQQPLAELLTLPKAPSLLLHFAYLTREKTREMTAEAYVATNRALSQLAVQGGGIVGVERVFLTSSGAVHAALAEPDDPDPELLYGRLKLEDEAMLESFTHAAPARRAIIARLFNLSGPYINKLDSYALASFIRQARMGHIEIRATHRVIRSYTSAANLLGVALGRLLVDDGEAFLCIDTAGDQEVEVGELARIVRELVSPYATIESAEREGEPIDHYVGDGAHYRRLLGEHGIAEHSLRRQIADTAEYLAQLDTAQH